MHPGRRAAARARRLGSHRPGRLGRRERARVRGHAARAPPPASRPRRSSWSTRATARASPTTSVLKLLQERLQARAPVAPRASGDRPGGHRRARSRSSRGGRRRRSCAARLSRFGRDCAIAFSGAEDVALIDMAAKTRPAVLALLASIPGGCTPRPTASSTACARTTASRSSWSRPNAAQLQAFVRKKGLFSFYEDGHQECCAHPQGRAAAPRRSRSTAPG